MALDSYLSRLRGMTRERALRSLSFRTMRLLGRFEPVRSLSATGATRRSRRASERTVFAGVSPDRCVSDIRENGYALGLKLPADLLAEIAGWAQRTPCFGNMNTKWGFVPADRERAEAAAGERFTVAHYYNATRCPAIAALRDDPLLREISERFIGPKARYIATHMWWSFARDEFDVQAQHDFAQMFHYDLDDYRFLKVFFYLTDVDAGSGPHVYVRGSNHGRRLSQLFPLRRYSDSEVESWFGEDRIDSITAPAGSGFVVDTFGIHKGAAPTRRDRLLLQFEFAQRAYGFESDVVSDDELERLV